MILGRGARGLRTVSPSAFLHSPTVFPDAMRGNLFAGGSIPHHGCDVAELWGLSFSCVRKMATNQVGLAVLALVATLVVRYVRSPWRHVPPGPRGLPIIGNTFEMGDKSWLLGKDCKQKYSTLSTSTTTDMTLTLTASYQRICCT